MASHPRSLTCYPLLSERAHRSFHSWYTIIQIWNRYGPFCSQSSILWSQHQGQVCFLKKTTSAKWSAWLHSHGLYCLSFAVQIGVPCLFDGEKPHHSLWWALSMSPRTWATKTQGRKERWVRVQGTADGVNPRTAWPSSAPCRHLALLMVTIAAQAGERSLLGQTFWFVWELTPNCLQLPSTRMGRTGRL